MILNPSALLKLKISRPTVMRNIGREIASRCLMFRWLLLMKSATIKRAERKAVSPLVIGAATIPRIARMPPAVPSHWLDMSLATFAPEYATPVASSAIPFSWKKYVAAAAQMSATMPSVTMAP